MTKRITLDFEEAAGSVVAVVTFPLPYVGTLKTVRVAVSDDDARAMIGKVQAILARRAAPKLGPAGAR